MGYSITRHFATSTALSNMSAKTYDSAPKMSRVDSAIASINKGKFEFERDKEIEDTFDKYGDCMLKCWVEITQDRFGRDIKKQRQQIILPDGKHTAEVYLFGVKDDDNTREYQEFLKPLKDFALGVCLSDGKEETTFDVETGKRKSKIYANIKMKRA